MSSFERSMQIIKGSKRLILWALVCVVFGNFFNMAQPLVIKTVVDSVIGGAPPDDVWYITWWLNTVGGIDAVAAHIWIASITVVLLVAVTGVFGFIRGRLASLISMGMITQLRDSLYDHIQKLPYEYHVTAQTGDLIQRCSSDVETIRKFFSAQLMEVCRTIVMVSIALPIMFSLNLKLAVVSCVFFPPVVLFSFFFHKRIKETFLAADRKEGELSTVLQENLSGVRVVRAFGREKFEMDKFGQRNNELRSLSMKINHNMSLFWSSLDLISAAQSATVVICGCVLAMKGDLSIGTLIAFLHYVGMLIWPIRGLGRILGDMGKMQVSLERVNEILNTPEETDTKDAKPYDLRGDIEFKNVSFAYGDSTPVLDGMSFKVKCGETVAILGGTGSGKSTLMLLLLRLYDYESGSITIGGVELNRIEKHHLRKNIGIVLQEPFLFSKTVKENLEMARENIAESEIYRAASTAAVHNVITGFEDGYDTLIGEKGVTLSGGQKQRVAIARTLIKDSSVLIFDDSLSAVDTETDNQIRAALRNNQKGVTTFIISQRITTLMSADRIFIMEHGRITDTGTHDELISRDGLYKRIWDIQTMLEEDFDASF